MIDDLFELSLSELGALSYSKKTISLAPLVKTCVEHFQVKAQAARVTLKDNVDATQDYSIVADSDRLQQLFSKLLENSNNYFVGSLHIWGAVLFLVCIVLHIKHNAKTYKNHMQKRPGKWSMGLAIAGIVPLVMGLILICRRFRPLPFLVTT